MLAEALCALLDAGSGGSSRVARAFQRVQRRDHEKEIRRGDREEGDHLVYEVAVADEFVKNYS